VVFYFSSMGLEADELCSGTSTFERSMEGRGATRISCFLGSIVHSSRIHYTASIFDQEQIAKGEIGITTAQTLTRQTPPRRPRRDTLDENGDKMNWKSFSLGFVAGVVLLSAISHWRARPQDVTAAWPDDDRKKGMKMLAPWVTKARSWKLGPFAVFAPSDPSQKAEAMMHPVKTKFPMVNVSVSQLG